MPTEHQSQSHRTNSSAPHSTGSKTSVTSRVLKGLQKRMSERSRSNASGGQTMVQAPPTPDPSPTTSRTNSARDLSQHRDSSMAQPTLNRGNTLGIAPSGQQPNVRTGDLPTPPITRKNSGAEGRGGQTQLEDSRNSEDIDEAEEDSESTTSVRLHDYNDVTSHDDAFQWNGDVSNATGTSVNAVPVQRQRQGNNYGKVKATGKSKQFNGNFTGDISQLLAGR